METFIGISLLTQTHHFYLELEKGMMKEAETGQVRLDIQSSKFSQTRQNEQVEEFIKKKVNAVILSPCDAFSVGEAIEKPNKANIPVFTADIANFSKKGKVIAHIGSDNLKGGNEAARLLAQAISNEGKVVIIDHPGATSVLERIQGFRKTISFHPDIWEVAQLPAWGEKFKAMELLRDFIKRMPDIKGIFATNADAAVASASIAKESKSKLAIVGFDGTPEVKELINKGEVYADIGQFPARIGEEAVKSVKRFLQGEHISPRITIDISIYPDSMKIRLN